VAIRIAERGDWSPADMLVDADGLAGLVVNEVDFGQAQDRRLAVAHFEAGLGAAPDDLLGRYAIDFFRPWPHEIDPAAGDDESLEIVGPQIGQELKHRLVDHLRIEPA